MLDDREMWRWVNTTLFFHTNWPEYYVKSQYLTRIETKCIILTAKQASCVLFLIPESDIRIPFIISLYRVILQHNNMVTLKLIELKNAWTIKLIISNFDGNMTLFRQNETKCLFQYYTFYFNEYWVFMILFVLYVNKHISFFLSNNEFLQSLIFYDHCQILSPFNFNEYWVFIYVDRYDVILNNMI